MLVQRIQSTNQIYKPMAKKASQTAQKKLQQVALYGTLAGLAISEPVNAKTSNAMQAVCHAMMLCNGVL